MKQSMYGTARKIEILENYQSFEATHGNDFASLQTLISSVDQGLAFLGNSGNFAGGVNGYKGVTFAEQDWFKNLKDFNKSNNEDRYEVVNISKGFDAIYMVYKNGKIDEKKTTEYNKLLTKQQWEVLMTLGPEVFKILVGLDDVEILLDDGSSSGQKVQASIFLILSVTPVDKIKDVIKAAKTLNKGENLLDGVKLSAESLEALKKIENSGETVKIIKKVETLDDLKKLKNTENFTDKSLKHIFEGELTKRGASGYHVDTIDETIGKIIEGTKTPPNKYGVYEAQVEVNGVLKVTNDGKSTFFPDDWDSQKIIDSINEAYANKVFDKGNIYVGKLNSGMEIEMYIGKDGKIISAFPKF